MADNSSQPGTSAGGSKNINITVSGNEIECLTQNFKGASYQQAEKIFNVYAEIMKNVTFNINNCTSNTSTPDIDYCPAPVSTFLGRSEELETLKTLLTEHQMVALVGMGGLGKTQLSRKYVQVNKTDYKYRYWLESETPKKLENSFKELANILDIESDNINKVVNDVYKKIQAVPTILVFDNVEKPADVYAYLPTRVDLPPGVTIHVLVTSRWTEWTCDEQIQCYKLEPLDISASLQIFQRKFGESCIDTMQDKWEELAEILGYLPLALQVATSYLYKRYKHNSNLSKVLADYMKQLSQGADGLLNDPLTEYGNRSVYASMLLSLKQLENETGDKWKFAVRLINTTAYMNPDKIEMKSLVKLLDNDDKTWILDDALIILTECSLFNQGVDREQETFYSVHRIIQTSVRHNQTVMGTADMYYTGILKYVFAEDDFPREVLMYANERVSVFMDYYEKNPLPSLLTHLVLYKAIKAVQSVFKLMPANQIESQVQQQNLLYYAVDSGDLSMVQLLHHIGADINQLCQEKREPPLHLALRRGNMEIATWMLNNGAVPTQRSIEGSNALHEASMFGNHKMVSVIIKTDRAVVNETDDFGQTPLHIIDYSSNEKDILSTIRLLAESGTDFLAVDKHGSTVLHSAARGACAAAVSLILQLNKDLINIVSKAGETALHVIPYGDKFIDELIDDERILSTIRVLVESGVDLTKVDVEGNTVLHAAAKGARAAAVSLILQLNIDLINIVNKSGETALHVIPYSKYEDDERILSTMRVLIESGVDLTTVDIRGNTVLHTAARSARGAAVSLILQLNKDLINILNEDGETALHVSGNVLDLKFMSMFDVGRNLFFSRMKETTRVLIMNGLYLDTRDNKGRTPLDSVEPEFKDTLLEVAEECNNQLLVRPVKRQRTE